MIWINEECRVRFVAARSGQGRPSVFTERSKVKFRKTACAVCTELESRGHEGRRGHFSSRVNGEDALRGANTKNHFCCIAEPPVQKVWFSE